MAWTPPPISQYAAAAERIETPAVPTSVPNVGANLLKLTPYGLRSEFGGRRLALRQTIVYQGSNLGCFDRALADVLKNARAWGARASNNADTDTGLALEDESLVALDGFLHTQTDAGLLHIAAAITRLAPEHLPGATKFHLFAMCLADRMDARGLIRGGPYR
jgi:hypothetical protein